MQSKKHRLPAAAYYGRKILSCTAVVESRHQAFVNSDLVDELLKLLASSAKQHQCLVPVYCFMPDHFHVIFFGETDRSNGKLAMDRFKHASGICMEQYGVAFDWQAGYWDHLIRKHEDWKRQVFYIFNNPVRSRLVESGFEYPFTGAIGMSLAETIYDIGFS